MAGGAGMLYLITLERTTFNVGFFLGIKAFTAAVLGGIGNLRGALLGGLSSGSSRTTARPSSARQWRDAIAFVVLILVLHGPAHRHPRRAARPGAGLMGIDSTAIRSGGAGEAMSSWWRALPALGQGRRRPCSSFGGGGAAPVPAPTCPCSSRSSTRPGPTSPACSSTRSAVYVLVAIGLNIVVGQAGLLDLGYVAFFAIGAYTTAVLGLGPRQRCRGCSRVPIGVAVAMTAGVLLGLADAAVAGRLPGHRHARVRRDHPHHRQQHRLAGRPARHRRTSPSRRRGSACTSACSTPSRTTGWC